MKMGCIVRIRTTEYNIVRYRFHMHPFPHHLLLQKFIVS